MGKENKAKFREDTLSNNVRLFVLCLPTFIISLLFPISKI